MTLFTKSAAFLATASLFSLGAAMAQDTDPQAAVETEAQAETAVEAPAAPAVDTTEARPERAVLKATQIQSLVEDDFTKADRNEDGVLDPNEYTEYNRSTAATMAGMFAVNLDTAREIRIRESRVDISNSAAIADMLNNKNRGGYDTAGEADKIAVASEARFAELSAEGEVNVEALSDSANEAFASADTNANATLEDEELDRFAAAYTGLSVKPKAATEPQG